jgi:glycosyltransferase involved in cell wall biosynthesis
VISSQTLEEATERDGPAISAPSVSLCLLTLNEIDGCRHDVPNLPVASFDEVYAVDGGSTDGTVEYLESQGIRVIAQPRRGYNQAYICAFENCSSDALVVFHPKGSVDPSSVLPFRELFAQGYDLIVASRMMQGASNEEDVQLLKPRKWFVLWLGLVSSAIWRRNGPVIWDVLHGFRGMRRDSFFAIEPIPGDLTLDLEMIVRGYRKGFRMTEIPVRERRRIAGNTHFAAISTGWRYLVYLAKEFSRKA